MFEAIEIEEQHREHGARSLGFLDGAGQMCGEIEPVRQASQLIVMREVIEMLLLFEELRLNLATDADVVSGQREQPPRAKLQALND